MYNITMNPQNPSLETEGSLPTGNVISTYAVWYRLQDGPLLGWKKGIAIIHAGNLTISDKKSGQVVYSIPLTPDIKLRGSPQAVAITYINGREINIRQEKQYSYLFIPAWLYFLAYRVLLFKSHNVKQFIKDCYLAAGVMDKI